MASLGILSAVQVSLSQKGLIRGMANSLTKRDRNDWGCLSQKGNEQEEIGMDQASPELLVFFLLNSIAVISSVAEKCVK